MKFLSLLVSISLMIQTVLAPMAFAETQESREIEAVGEWKLSPQATTERFLELVDDLAAEGWLIESAPGRAMTHSELLDPQAKTIFIRPSKEVDMDLGLKVETVKLVNSKFEMKLMAYDGSFRKVLSRRMLVIDPADKEGKLARLKFDQTWRSMEIEIKQKLSANLSNGRAKTLWAILENLFIPSAHAESGNQMEPLVKLIDIGIVLACIGYVCAVVTPLLFMNPESKLGWGILFSGLALYPFVGSALMSLDPDFFAHKRHPHFPTKHHHNRR